MFHNSRRIFFGIFVGYKMNQNVVVVNPDQISLFTELPTGFSCKHFFLKNGSTNCIETVHDAVRYNEAVNKFISYGLIQCPKWQF